MLNSQDYKTVIRKYFQSGNLKLSYLDFGGDSQNILLMLHGHMGNARTFSELANKFNDWRVFSLDQRGHGWSEHPTETDYSRESYLKDIENFIRQELNGMKVVLLGHSLGGINAYQFASRNPELVKAVIVEDIGVEIGGDLTFAEKLPERSPSLKELRQSLERVGIKDVDYFSESVFEDKYGWGFRSDLKGMRISQQNINGSWWEDWLSTSCSILLIHGKKSFVLDLKQAELMVSKRPNTKLEVFDECGHNIHLNELDRFYEVVKKFLFELNN